MKKIIILAALLLSTITTNAQKQTAAQILDAAAARISQKGGLSGQFTATSFKGKNTSDQISGSMTLQGRKYTLTTPDMHTWYNGEHLWTLITGSNEVNQTKPTQAEFNHSAPTAFIGMYKSGYDLSLKTVRLRGQKANEVTMKAQSKTRQPERVIIDLDPSTAYPMCMRVLYKGNWTRITITGVRSGSAKDSDFEFPSKDYPGVSVVKL